MINNIEKTLNGCVIVVGHMTYTNWFILHTSTHEYVMRKCVHKQTYLQVK